MEIELGSQDTNNRSEGGHGQADEVDSNMDSEYSCRERSISRHKNRCLVTKGSGTIGETVVESCGFQELPE